MAATFCPECPHCRAVAELRSLVLPPRPAAGGRAGLDVGFYRAFAGVYDEAVARFPQPMRRIREANPGLSRDQCSAYLKRARGLGFVRTPAAVGAPGMPLAELAGADPVPAAEVVVPTAVGDPVAEEEEGPTLAWLPDAPQWLDERMARWLIGEGAVRAYDYAAQATDATRPGTEEAELDLAELAAVGLGTWNGTTFRWTGPTPPKPARGGRPRRAR